MKINVILLLGVLINIVNPASCQETSRWSLVNDESIKWEVKERDSHMDHIEMSGFYVSGIVHYGVEKGFLKQKIHLVFPMLRTIPNDTHASLAHTIDNKNIPKIKVNGVALIEKPQQFSIKGILSYESKTAEGLEIKHQLFPSTDQPVFIDKIKLENKSDKTVKIEFPKMYISHTTDAEKGVGGSYIIELVSTKDGRYELRKNESLEYALIYSARKVADDAKYISADYELHKRVDLINQTFSDLVFESPNETLNRTFKFAKLRAVESIFATKGGLMHAPGGGRYYAAIWANDQAEYANPFFPFLGNHAGNESAINSFRHFARFMNEEYKPIPSSIVAEGLDFWNGAGDRGDMAMIAYGAARFAMAYGDKNTAKELWPLVEWCLEYSKRKVTNDGVVASDSDELEGRFAAGNANLNTSCLHYDALISAVLLGKELSIKPTQLDQYETEAVQLKLAIEKYFGADRSGFKTYQYFKDNDFLRAWIATPLTVDIFDRKEGTIDALFSDKLWTKDGLASQANTKEWKESVMPFLRFEDLQGYDARDIAHTEKLFDHPVLNKNTYSQSDFDDSAWGEVNLPGRIEKMFKGLEPEDGVFWFRKKIIIDDLYSDYIFKVDGVIDDAAKIYFNGQAIGASIWNSTPNEFIIPKSVLLKGQNTIAINFIDGGGSVGGFFGELYLEKSSGEQISLGGDWRYKFHGFLGNYRYFIEGNEKNKKILANQEKIKTIFKEDGVTTFWDRATLYAFRGALAAGETKRTLSHLKDYSERRLLGDHVPYPVEAYPEGNQRHLSAESALYCRVIIEGLFGIRPMGFCKFDFSPKLPDDWEAMSLRNIKAFNRTFDVTVKRKNNRLSVRVYNENEIFLTTEADNGATINLSFK